MPALPEELLDLIFSHLAFPFGRSSQDFGLERHTLFSLCLVSKQCHRLALPILYHTINLLWDTNCHLCSEANRLQRLVRTLIYQPSLVRFVAQVYMDDVYLDDDYMADDKLEDLPYEEAVSSHTVDDGIRDDLLASLRNGSCGAHAALFLSLCQDVQDLSLVLPHRWSDTFTGHVLSSAAGGSDPSIDSTSKALSSLKELSLNWYDSEGCLKLYGRRPFAHDEDDWYENSGLSHLFRLSNLEVFHGDMMDLQAEDGQYESFQSNLIRIHLTQSLIDAEGLALILQACPKLHELSVEWGLAIVGDCQIDFAEIGKELARFGQCLEIITLDWLPKAIYDNDDCGGLGDLSQMASLKTLRVSAGALLGMGVESTITLPHSLQYLDIEVSQYKRGEHFMQQLNSVVERGKSHSLEAITYCGWNQGIAGGTEPGTLWTKTTEGSIHTEVTGRRLPLR